ncbi:MAG: two-component regulator propeller domain-containing protein [Gemmatimonadales bacterium]
MRRAAGCALALAGLAGVAEAQVLNFRSYTGREGLPQAQVLSLHQDRAGFLWIGTYGGLTRFDGADFQTYTRREGLSSNAVTAIAEDDRGRLVVGTYGGGVCFRQGTHFQCLGEAEGLPSADVTMVVPDGQGGLWIATEGGAAHLKDGRIRPFTMAEGLPSPHVTRIAVDDSGRVWAGTSAGLARLDDGRWRVVEDAPELADAPISVLLSTPTGLVVGTTDNIYRLHRGKVRTLPSPSTATGAPTGAAIDLVGQLWIATRSGAIRYRGDTAAVFTMDAGLLDDNLNGVLVDREGSVWFGTESGLAKLTPGPFSHFTTREGLPNPFVRALAEDQDGRLWAGTRGGIAIREGSGFRTIDFDGAPHDWVYDLAPAPGGGMLIATREGLVWHDRGVRRVYRMADGLPDDFVVSFLPGCPRRGSGGDGRRGWGLAGTEAGSRRFPTASRPDSSPRYAFSTPAATCWLRRGGIMIRGRRVRRDACRRPTGSPISRSGRSPGTAPARSGSAPTATACSRSPATAPCTSSPPPAGWSTTTSGRCCPTGGVGSGSSPTTASTGSRRARSATSAPATVSSISRATPRRRSRIGTACSGSAPEAA